MATMKEEQLQQIVTEIIRRLVPRLGADGSRGLLVTVFTGATVAFGVAMQQVRLLLLDGFRIQLVFSPAAEQLYGPVVRDQLAGFPHVDPVNSSKWLSTLRDASAVVTPLMSVNTVSKISSLIADNLSTNLILHALFMGKPVIAARDGADPEVSPGRDELGFHKGSIALRQALVQRLETAAQYGCRLVEVGGLRDAVNSVCPTNRVRGDEKTAKVSEPPSGSNSRSPSLCVTGKVVTASHIVAAHKIGADLALSRDSLVTPLARDLAAQHGVAFIQADVQ